MSDQIEYGAGAVYCGDCKQTITFVRGMDCGRPDCAMKKLGDSAKAIGMDALRKAIDDMRDGKHGPGEE